MYWDGGLLANRAWNGTTYFHHGDWLGTERMRTDYQGQVANTQTSQAFGDGFSQSSTDIYGAAQDNNQFTSQERDAESGTSHFQFRQYSLTQGRWMSPDPYDGSYDWTNPQSLNRYAYVLNNPYSLLDPDGLDSCYPIYGGGGDVSDGYGGVIAMPIGYNCSDSGGTFSPRSPRNSGDNSAGSSSAPSAPNNPGKPKQDCSQILKGAAVTVGLDAAGTFVGAIPGSGAALVTVQVTVGLAGAAHSAYQADAKGTLVNAFGAQASPIAAGAEQIAKTGGSVAWGRAAVAIPFVGSAVSAYYFYKDATKALDDYQACKAGS